MKSCLTFNFSAGSIDSQYMSIRCLNTKEEINVSDHFAFQLETELPIIVKFELSGKHSNDTIVENGLITHDKFIKLETLGVDNFEFESWRIPENYLFLVAEEQHIPTNYWGKNGVAHFVIDKADPAFWFLECPNFYS